MNEVKIDFNKYNVFNLNCVENKDEIKLVNKIVETIEIFDMKNLKENNQNIKIYSKEKIELLIKFK